MIEVKKLLRGRPTSFKALAKPTPCTSPKKNTISTRQGLSSLSTIFSTATNTIDKEITGSMIWGGAMIMLRILNASVMEWATVNAEACHRIVEILVLNKQRLMT